MKKKMRKFAEGGYETAEGENENVKEDTRSRAMKFIEDGSPEQDTGEKPVTITKTKTSVTASKPKADDSSEKERIESISKKQALETVSPELDFMPAAKLAAGAGALYAGARAVGKRVLAGRAAEKAAEETTKKAAVNAELKALGEKNAKTQATRAANKTRKSEEGFNPAEALKARKKAGMKAGGSVSSASRRADGCAIRGKTRA